MTITTTKLNNAEIRAIVYAACVTALEAETGLGIYGGLERETNECLAAELCAKQFSGELTIEDVLPHVEAFIRESDVESFDYDEYDDEDGNLSERIAKAIISGQNGVLIALGQTEGNDEIFLPSLKNIEVGSDTDLYNFLRDHLAVHSVDFSSTNFYNSDVRDQTVYLYCLRDNVKDIVNEAYDKFEKNCDG